MAANTPRPLNLEIAPEAYEDLAAIWLYNAETYGAAHADDYREFLLAGIEDLPRRPQQGRALPDFPALYYLVLKKSRRGHGHIAVYAIKSGLVKILSFFHTAQDWVSRLKEKSK